MRKLVLLIAALFLLVSAAAAQTPQAGSAAHVLAVHPRYFENPEDAIVQFAQSLAQGDTRGALDTMADYAKAEEFDLAARLEYFKALLPPLDSPYPSGTYAAFVPVNTIIARGSNARDLFAFLVSLASEGSLDLSRIQRADKEGNLLLPNGETLPADRLEANLDPLAFAGLELQFVFMQGGEAFLDPQRQVRINAAGISFGYSETREFIAVYDYNGKQFRHTYTTGLFGDGWQILYLRSSVLGILGSHGAQLLLPEEIQAIAADPDYTLVYSSAE